MDPKEADYQLPTRIQEKCIQKSSTGRLDSFNFSSQKIIATFNTIERLGFNFVPVNISVTYRQDVT